MRMFIAMFVGSLLYAAALPSSAAACACCDSGYERRVVGWSDSGASALVQAQGINCTDTLALEVMRQGQAEPVGCFDVYSTRPSRRVACTGLTEGYDRFGMDRERPTPAAHPRFPRAPQLINGSHVRGSLRPLPDDGAHVRPWELRVDVLIAGRWRNVFSRSVYPGRKEHDEIMGGLTGEEEDSGPIPPDAIEVRIWPSPTNTSALVEVSGHNKDPSMGFYEDEVHWVRLPEGLPRTAEDAEGRVFAATEMPSTGSTSRDAQAQRINRHALALHSAGHHARAAEVFAAMLIQAPRDAVARYNLACTLARMGRPEAALFLLREIASNGCDGCRERIERARRDRDLRGLRSRLPRVPAE